MSQTTATPMASDVSRAASRLRPNATCDHPMIQNGSGILEPGISSWNRLIRPLAER